MFVTTFTHRENKLLNTLWQQVALNPENAYLEETGSFPPKENQATGTISFDTYSKILRKTSLGPQCDKRPIVSRKRFWRDGKMLKSFSR